MISTTTVKTIVMIGFDGSSDNRNRYQGTQHYRNRATAEVTYQRWERTLHQNIELKGKGKSIHLLLGHGKTHTLDEVVQRGEPDDLWELCGVDHP